MQISTQSTVIGWVGTGIMGKSMAGHLQDAGYKIVVYTRTKEKAQSLLDNGAVWAGSARDVATQADVIFTIVGFPEDVREVYLGENGLIENAKQGSILCDMTTSDPTLAKQIAESALKRDIHVLDAPVSGGDVGAREARLSIMVGGERETFDKVLPLFELMGKNVVYQGVAGAGQHTKMCNQITIASGMIGVAEALLYARKSGLDQKTVLKSIGSGAAGSWSLNNLGPRIIDGNFDPGFFVKHFIKDMDIALTESKQMGMQTPGLTLARQLYQQVADANGTHLGTQAIYLAIEKLMEE